MLTDAGGNNGLALCVFVDFFDNIVRLDQFAVTIIILRMVGFQNGQFIMLLMQVRLDIMPIAI